MSDEKKTENDNEGKDEPKSLDERLAVARQEATERAESFETEEQFVEAIAELQKKFDEIYEGPRNLATSKELREVGARKDVLTVALNEVRADFGSDVGNAKIDGDDDKKDDPKSSDDDKSDDDDDKKDDPKSSDDDKSDDEDDDDKGGDPKADVDLPAPDELDAEDLGPRPLVSASAGRGRGRTRNRGSRRLTASALGGTRDTLRRNKASRKPIAPIIAAVTTNQQTGNEMTFDEFGSQLSQALASPGEALTIVASVNPYGQESEWDEDQLLTGDASKNHEILFGGREDLAVTAAVCGPAEPIREIPTCFTAEQPILDSLTTRQAQYGSIQVYAPAQLPEGAAGVMIPAPDCPVDTDGKCDMKVPIECLTVDCVDPLAPVPATPSSACLCVSESLAFSAPYVLESYMELLSARYAQVLEVERLRAIREQSYNRTFTPPYGAAAGLVQAAAQVMHLINSNGRYNGPTDDYQIVIPSGMTYTALADIMNRIFNCDHALDDYLGELDALGISTIIQTLDADAMHCDDGALNVPGTFLGDVGSANCVPLEGFHQNPSIYVYRKDSFLTASPFKSEVGVDSRNKDELASGCTRMIKREWWVPPVKFGCAPSVVLDFGEFCAAGTGPDAMAPVKDCDMVGGGGAASDAPGD